MVISTPLYTSIAGIFQSSSNSSPHPVPFSRIRGRNNLTRTSRNQTGFLHCVFFLNVRGEHRSGPKLSSPGRYPGPYRSRSHPASWPEYRGRKNSTQVVAQAAATLEKRMPGIKPTCWACASSNKASASSDGGKRNHRKLPAASADLGFRQIPAQRFVQSNSAPMIGALQLGQIGV